MQYGGPIRIPVCGILIVPFQNPSELKLLRNYRPQSGGASVVSAFNSCTWMGFAEGMRVLTTQNKFDDPILEAQIPIFQQISTCTECQLRASTN